MFLYDIGTTLCALEEETPWANKAELYIKLMKEAVQKDMQESHSPLPFWDYYLERRVWIYNVTACDYHKVQGSNLYTLTLGEEGDISNICQFQWYQWCYFHEHTACFPHNQEVLGQVLGPARSEGNKMAQWVLKANLQVVPWHSVCALHPTEETSSMEQSTQQTFDTLIERRYGNSINPPLAPIPEYSETFDPYEDDQEPARPIPVIEDTVDFNSRLLEQAPSL